MHLREYDFLILYIHWNFEKWYQRVYILNFVTSELSDNVRVTWKCLVGVVPITQVWSGREYMVKMGFMVSRWWIWTRGLDSGLESEVVDVVSCFPDALQEETHITQLHRGLVAYHSQLSPSLRISLCQRLWSLPGGRGEGDPPPMTGQCGVECIAPGHNLWPLWGATSAPEFHMEPTEAPVLDASWFNFFLCPTLHPSLPLRSSWELPNNPPAPNLSISVSVSRMPDLGQHQAFQAESGFGIWGVQFG